MTDSKIWISNARAIATISVIVLHVASSISYMYGKVPNDVWFTGNLFDSAVRFCVPVFFMISGALLLSKDYEITDFIRKRIIRIIPPLIFFSLLYILYAVYIESKQTYTCWEFCKIACTGILSGSKYHLWFVYTLLGLYLFVPIIRKWIKHATHKEMLYFLLIWFATLLYRIPMCKMYLPNIEIINYSGYLGYMVLGYFLINTEIKKMYIPYLLIFIGIAITFFGTYFLTEKHNQFSAFFYEYLSLNIVITSIGVFIVLQKLQITNSILQRIFSIISEYSYGIYLVHVLVLAIFEKYGFSEQIFHPIFSIPLVSIACLVVSGGIIYLMKKNIYIAKIAG